MRYGYPFRSRGREGRLPRGLLLPPVLLLALAPLPSARGALPPSYLQAPSVSSYDADSTGITAEFWVRVRSKPGFDPRILDITNAETGPCGYEPAAEFSVFLCNLSDCGPGTVLAEIKAGGACSFIATTARIDDGKYHHVAAIQEKNALRIYVDGVLGAEGEGLPVPVRLAGGTIVVGSAADHGNSFDGEIDEVRLWKGARTPEEIRTGMGREIPSPLPDALVGYWPMNGDGADRAPSRNPLVPHNDVVFLPGKLGRAAHVLNLDALRGDAAPARPNRPERSGGR